MYRKLNHISLLTVVAITGCGQSPRIPAPPPSTPTADIKMQIVQFCGDCHAYPPADMFPKGFWDDEVRRGFKFYTDSGRTDLKVPVIREVVDYYELHAPEEHKLQIPSEVTDSGPVRFEKQTIQSADREASIGVADILFAEGKLFLSDMKNGQVLAVNTEDLAAAPTVVWTGRNPCHLESCDIDEDGVNELLISDLGTFQPGDHTKGQVVVVDPSQSRNIVVKSNLGRVADVKYADVTGDGRNDIVVAEFGWRKTGRLLLLERTSSSDDGDLSADSFRERTLDDRHGASHVSLVDLNNDSKLDLITLFSQEHECVVSFTNQGDGNFTKKEIFEARRPDYGSSCLNTVDLDADGDVDVLYVNGDSMDSRTLKPVHSVQWLENVGNGEFVHHHIDRYPGAYGIASGDFDSDGDVDVVAVSMTWWHDVPFNSVIWFEQRDDRTFVRHNLDFSTGQHAVVKVGDFDKDGDPDIAVGEFEERPVASPVLCTIWWNSGRVKTAPE